MLNMLQLNQTKTIQPADCNIKNFNVMPDLSKSIERFSGEKGSSEAKYWLQQLENMAILHSWPDAFTSTLQTAKSQLESAAKYWFMARTMEITDWRKFKAAFTKTFILKKICLNVGNECEIEHNSLKKIFLCITMRRRHIAKGLQKWITHNKLKQIYRIGKNNI